MPHEAKLLREYDRGFRLHQTGFCETLMHLQTAVDQREVNESVLKQRMDQTERQVQALQESCEELRTSISSLALQISVHNPQGELEEIASNGCGRNGKAGSGERQDSQHSRNVLFLQDSLPLWQAGDTPLGSHTEESAFESSDCPTGMDTLRPDASYREPEFQEVFESVFATMAQIKQQAAEDNERASQMDASLRLLRQVGHMRAQTGTRFAA